MDRLRWVLLLIGGAIILAIYLWGRWRERDRLRRSWIYEDGDEGVASGSRSDRYGPHADPEDAELHELGRRMSVSSDDIDPALSVSMPAQTSTDASPARESPASADETPSVRRAPRRAPSPPLESASAARAPLEQKLVVVYVAAHSGSHFAGPDIVEATRVAGLEYGDMRIFHRYSESGDGRQMVFSVANMVKPGDFDLDNMDGFESPGLTMFLQLPGPDDPLQAVDAMLVCAEKLKQHLNGELRDASRSVLSQQTIGHLREEIQEYARRIGISNARGRT